jgi:hypothetical protein
LLTFLGSRLISAFKEVIYSFGGQMGSMVPHLFGGAASQAKLVHAYGWIQVPRGIQSDHVILYTPPMNLTTFTVLEYTDIRSYTLCMCAVLHFIEPGSLIKMHLALLVFHAVGGVVRSLRGIAVYSNGRCVVISQDLLADRKNKLNTRI